MADRTQDHTGAGPQARASRPLATPTAGYDYLASGAHYISLARRILAALERDKLLVLLIGDPAPNSIMLRDALADAVAGEYEAVEIVSGSGFDADRLHRGSGRGLVVADEAANLNAEICDRIVAGQTGAASVVLAGRPELIARLEELRPGLCHDARVARLETYELGREEIDSFIRRQLPPGEEVGGLTAEALDGIADFSGGDPAQVNRLARLMLDFPHWGGSQREAQPADEVAEPPPVVAPRRQYAAWAAAIAVLLCTAAAIIIRGDMGGEAERPGLTQMVAETAAPASPIAPPAPILEAPPVEVASAPPEAAPSGEVEQAMSRPAEEPVPPEQGAEQGDTPAAHPAENPAPAAVEPALSAEQVAALVARGELFVQSRDLSSARLYFQRAAEAGDAHAALRMAQTFDSAFLARIGIWALQGDRQQAISWYQRAHERGDAEAARRLEEIRQP